MLFANAAPLFFSALLTTTTLAAPTQKRTQCRCKIISDAPSPATYTPSAAHWSPWDPAQSPTVADDICSSLGTELENFDHTYNSYVRQSSQPAEQKPPSMTILLDEANHEAQQHDRQDGEEEPRPTSRPQQRITCYLQPEPYSAFHSSFISLWALQIIVGVSVVACIAEAVYLGTRILSRRNAQQREAHVPHTRGLRLPGGERLLLAIPVPHVHVDAVASPGSEKKMRAYEATARCFVKQAASGKREFIAYDDEDDGEENRPVM